MLLTISHLLLIVHVTVKTVFSEESLIASKEYCPSVSENDLTWPQTQAGVEAYPQEYCFKEDGVRLSRLCIADSSGPLWAEITDICTIPVESSVSKDLFTLIEEYYNHSTSTGPLIFYPKIVNLSTHYSEFNAFDVYLTGTIMYRAFILTTSVYAAETITVFDNILSIDGNVLKEAEIKMHAAEPWLSTLRYMQKNLKVLNQQIEKTNFGFEVTSEGSSITGALVQNFGTGRNISEIGFLVTLDSVLETENLETAVWYYTPPDSRPHKLSVIFYWNHGNALFFDESVPMENVITVTDVWMITTPDNPIQVIYRFEENAYNQNLQCASWQIGNDTRDSWKINGEFQIVLSKSVYICTYQEPGTFGLLLSSEKTVTESLTDLLNSNSFPEILSRMFQFSSRHAEFAATDVTLIAQLLEKISASNETDLQLLHQVLNNLHNINTTVLAESQRTNKSTDAILYYVDVILQNSAYTSDLQLNGDNVVTLVYNLNNSDFSGVAFRNGTVEILKDDVNITELLSDENLDSALVLSPELKNQLNKSDKIALNLFLTNVLFNENNADYSFVSNVFGVLLPEISTNYSGPVSIIHKVNAGNHGQTCSYWLYDVPQSVTGSWKNDSSGAHVTSTMVQCDYWHTTHFGFLLTGDSNNGSSGYASDYYLLVVAVLWLLWYSSPKL